MWWKYVEINRKLLEYHYGLTIISIKKIEGGWTSIAYHIQTNESSYFLKVYDKNRLSIKSYIDRIPYYLPIMEWVEKETELNKKIPQVYETKDGKRTVETEDVIYLLYPFIDGKTIGEKNLSNEQIKEYAQMIAVLHSYGENIPVST